MNVGREENPPSAPANMESSELVGAHDFLEDELLPDILNDVVVQVIAPKFSAKDINVLSLVSPTWLEAIHRRWVYDARVRSHSTETFVVVSFVYDDAWINVRDWTYKLRLYSLHDNSAYDLPPIPRPGFRQGYKCISLDGKLYMLGGGALRLHGPPYIIPDGWEYCASREVFMIDLAGQKQWKQCASMQEPRNDFGAGVLDGKIYVFGGQADNKFTCKSEVYDPKIDAWSSIADMIVCRTEHQVATVGEELFVYGGKKEIDSDNFDETNSDKFDFSQDLVAYHPVKNEWRQSVHSNTGDRVVPGILSYFVPAFVAQGKFHTMTENGIDVYDIEKRSWRGLHSFSDFRDISGEFSSDSFEATYVLPLGDEIQILYFSYRRLDPLDPLIVQGCVRLTQTTGFGSKNKEVVVQEIANSRLPSGLCSRYSDDFDICLIQL